MIDSAMALRLHAGLWSRSPGFKPRRRQFLFTKRNEAELKGILPKSTKMMEESLRRMLGSVGGGE